MKRLCAVVSRAADAAGVDDETAVSEPHHARKVGVPAKDQGRINAENRGLDFLDGRSLNLSILSYPIQPPGCVALRRAVTEQHIIAIYQCRRQACQPVEVALIQLLVIEAAGCSGRTKFNQPPVLIASNRRKTARYQQIGRSSRFKRAAEVISEINDIGDADGGDVREHSFKRAAVAMNIGDRSEFHRPASWSVSRRGT
jgi:hypothetical protein